MVQYILLHFVGIHLKYSILYLKHCLSVPSHYQYWLQVIDIHPRAISQNISKIWWQFFMYLSMVNELINKPCTSWVSVSLQSPMSPCMTGQLGQPTHPASWPSQLTKDCQPSECTEEHYVSLPGMEHMSVELRKYMIIHIYGITLNAAKSADQYYSSYSYKSLSLIIYLTYNDLHHDCKPYEQTREFFTVSLYSP